MSKRICLDIVRFTDSVFFPSRALGNTQDLAIAEETLEYMWTKAKDQDFHYFFYGLSTNNKTKRLLRSYLFKNYDKVRDGAS